MSDPNAIPNAAHHRRTAFAVLGERIGGVSPAAIALAVGAMSASETSPSTRVDPEVRTPR